MVLRSPALRVLAGAALPVVLGLAGCGAIEPLGDPDPDRVDQVDRVDRVERPVLGSCRVLTPEDVAAASNATTTVPCDRPHTAETYAVGEMPAALDEAAYDAPEVSDYAYQTCATKFEAFLGADESLALRTVVSWAWFRPSEEAWADGDRWYRCDVVGGGAESTTYVPLPESAKGLLLGRPDDRWMVCADGETVAGSPKVACDEPHQWRAVTTIKVGEEENAYPGDRVVEVTTRDFCSDSVGAWLNYPIDFEYAYTYFHEAEWEAGNRRSVCWARTPD